MTLAFNKGNINNANDDDNSDEDGDMMMMMISEFLRWWNEVVRL